ncbi:MAG: hypothetical protein ISR78_01270 [Spirochaetia bacterium]|nr:hypothetical protein [Spirochaetia bacterium]
MFKKVISLFLIVFCLHTAVFAGDRAEFINLGFSRDSKAFLFGQYGKNESGTLLYADVLYHDLVSGENSSELSLSRTYPDSQRSGNNGLSALLMNLKEYNSMYTVDIDYTQTGTTLYFQLPGQKTGDMISFSDYQVGTVYSVTFVMRPQVREPGTNTALAITLFQTLKDGTQNRYEAGSLIKPIQDVYDFQLKQVIVSPKRDYVVLVFQTTEYDIDNNTTNIRYYVDSMKIK